MATAERSIEVVKLWAPIVIGIVLVIVGGLNSDWGIIGIGAGLLGVPGISEVVKGISSPSQTGADNSSDRVVH